MSPGPHVLTPAYYERLAEIEGRHWWALGLRAIATRVLDHVAPADRRWRVLDDGCGTGLTLSWIRRYTDTEPVGLDLARAGLAFCARRGHRRLAEASALDLPLPGGAFDLVLSLDVLQHLPRPGGDVRALAEMARVLAPGGLLLLRTNSRCGYPATHAADYHRYTLAELRALVRAAGLAIEIATYVNFLPGLLGTIRRRLSFRRGVEGDPGLTLEPRPPDASLVTRLLYRALLAEGAYLASGRRALPFGHSILILAIKAR